MEKKKRMTSKKCAELKGKTQGTYVDVNESLALTFEDDVVVPDLSV